MYPLHSLHLVIPPRLWNAKVCEFHLFPCQEMSFFPWNLVTKVVVANLSHVPWLSKHRLRKTHCISKPSSLEGWFSIVIHLVNTPPPPKKKKKTSTKSSAIFRPLELVLCKLLYKSQPPRLGLAQTVVEHIFRFHISVQQTPLQAKAFGPSWDWWAMSRNMQLVHDSMSQWDTYNIYMYMYIYYIYWVCALDILRWYVALIFCVDMLRWI